MRLLANKIMYDNDTEQETEKFFNSICVLINPLKMSRGRPKSEKSDILEQLFQSKEDKIILNDKVLSPSAAIWCEFNSYGNAKAIYTAALRWWKGRSKPNEEINQNDTKASMEISLESKDDSSTSLNSSAENEVSTKKFSIVLSNEVWKTIEPCQTVYNRKITKTHKSGIRSYYVMKPGVWTNVISDRIADSRANIICNWSFNKAKVYQSSEVYVDITASCATCKAVLHGVVKNKPKNDVDPVRFSFSVQNFDEKRHKDKDTVKSVKNYGVRPYEYGTSSKTAMVLTRQRIKATTKMFEAPKGRQFTANAVRCAQYRNKLAKKLSSCPYTALEYLQESHSCAHTIHLNSRSPFACLYFSPSQLQLFTAYRRHNKYIKICCDASGNFVFKLDRPVRDFYIRCVALLVKTKTLEDAKYLIHAILVVALSKTEGSTEEGLETPCETFKQILVRRIQGLDLNVESTFSESDNAENPEKDEKDMNEDNANETDSLVSDYEIHREKEHDEYIKSFEIDDSRFSDFITNVTEEATTEATTNDYGDRDNLMYNSRFAKYFIDLAKTLPIWSAINCQFFEGAEETATSTNVESYFKDCKRSHRDLIPCRVDAFVTEDIKLIDGWVIEASQKYLQNIGGRNILEHDSFEHNLTEPEPIEPILIEEMYVDGSSDAQNTTQYEDNSLEDSQEDCEIDKDDSSALQKKLWDLYHHAPVQNLESIANSGAGEKQLKTCIACINEHVPDGAHRCHKCGKNVHVLSGCSNSIDDEEGYGEKRICISCSNDSTKTRPHKRSHPMSVDDSVPVDNFSSELAKTLNNKEKWNRRKRTKQSSCLHPVPNWNLVFDVDKKVNIGLLSNGNISKTIYKVKGKAVALRNTCAFDSIVQILAAAYAYFEPYRSVANNSVDVIYEIAISLAKNENLRKVNGLRATLMCTLFERNNCLMVVSEVMSKALKNTPTYTEIQKCSNERCKYSSTKIFPSLAVCANTFKNDFRNLKVAILKNFPDDEPKCSICKTNVCTTITFGDHLFIEVPVTKYGHQHEDNYEFIKEIKLDDLPLSLEFDEKTYALFGVTLYQPPMISGDTGHYVGAVKLNNTWQVFDDFKTKPYNIKKAEKVVIHNLFYILRM